MMHTDLHSAGYLLDPEFIVEDTTTAVGTAALLRVGASMLGGGKAAAILTEFAAFRNKEGELANPGVWEAAETMPAHQWWGVACGELPTLQFMARLILSQVNKIPFCLLFSSLCSCPLSVTFCYSEPASSATSATSKVSFVVFTGHLSIQLRTQLVVVWVHSQQVTEPPVPQKM